MNFFFTKTFKLSHEPQKRKMFNEKSLNISSIHIYHKFRLKLRLNSHDKFGENLVFDYVYLL